MATRTTSSPFRPGSAGTNNSESSAGLARRRIAGSPGAETASQAGEQVDRDPARQQQVQQSSSRHSLDSRAAVASPRQLESQEGRVSPESSGMRRRVPHTANPHPPHSDADGTSSSEEGSHGPNTADDVRSPKEIYELSYNAFFESVDKWTRKDIQRYGGEFFFGALTRVAALGAQFDQSVLKPRRIVDHSDGLLALQWTVYVGCLAGAIAGHMLGENHANKSAQPLIAQRTNRALKKIGNQQKVEEQKNAEYVALQRATQNYADILSSQRAIRSGLYTALFGALSGGLTGGATSTWTLAGIEACLHIAFTSMLLADRKSMPGRFANLVFHRGPTAREADVAARSEIRDALIMYGRGKNERTISSQEIASNTNQAHHRRSKVEANVSSAVLAILLASQMIGCWVQADKEHRNFFHATEKPFAAYGGSIASVVGVIACLQGYWQLRDAMEKRAESESWTASR